MDDDQELFNKKVNISAIKRSDSEVIEVSVPGSHVALFRYNIHENKWVSAKAEGPIFIYKRKSNPKYGFCILNRLDSVNFTELIDKHLMIEGIKNFMMVLNKQRMLYCMWFFSEDECMAVSNDIKQILLDNNCGLESLSMGFSIISGSCKIDYTNDVEKPESRKVATKEEKTGDYETKMMEYNNKSEIVNCTDKQELSPQIIQLFSKMPELGELGKRADYLLEICKEFSSIYPNICIGSLLCNIINGDNNVVCQNDQSQNCLDRLNNRINLLQIDGEAKNTSSKENISESITSFTPETFFSNLRDQNISFAVDKSKINQSALIIDVNSLQRESSAKTQLTKDQLHQVIKHFVSHDHEFLDRIHRAYAKSWNN